MNFVEATLTLKQFLNFDVMWFFADLMIYGLAMSLVESLLLVYLNEAPVRFGV